MTNCHIIANSGCMAGGCTVDFGADVVFNGCSFSDNSVTGNGGGLWNEGNITMYDCTVSNNKADGQCGGYYGVGGWSRIYNSSFIGNDNSKTAGRTGGGAYLREGNSRGSDAVFVNCTFTGNKTSGNGGAVCVYGTSAVGANAKFISCTITGNTATNGGGICMYNATPTAAIYNCIISNNSTDIGITGTAQGSETQVSKQTSIIGSALLDAEGTTVGGWSFDASTMLGTLDFYHSSVTKSFPLIAGDTNPAINQGMSATDLGTLAGELSIDATLIAKDQNGQERQKKAIGSYALNN